MSVEELTKAIAIAKSGDKASAEKMLAKYIQENPTSETAWLWLSFCVATVEKKRFCLNKALAINPKNENTIKALSQLTSPHLESKKINVLEVNNEKARLVKEIEKLEAEKVKYESDLYFEQDNLLSSKPSYASSTFLFILGVISIFFNMYIGIFLVIISLLAAGLVGIRYSNKRRKIQLEIKYIQEDIAEIHKELGELRAKLIIL